LKRKLTLKVRPKKVQLGGNGEKGKKTFPFMTLREKDGFSKEEDMKDILISGQNRP